MRQLITDINECLLGVDGCRYPSYCINTRGSYQCRCYRGFEMRRGNCVGRSDQDIFLLTFLFFLNICDNF